MAAFNPYAPQDQNLFLLNRSGGPAPRDAGRTLTTGLAGLVDSGTKATYNAIVDDLDTEARTAVEMVQDYYGVSAQADVSSASVDALGADDDEFVVPPELERQYAWLEELQQGYIAGRFSDTHYYGQLQTVVRGLRQRYHGFENEIDQIVGRLTGVNPANAIISSLRQDAQDAASAAAGVQRDHADWLEDNRGDAVNYWNNYVATDETSDYYGVSWLDLSDEQHLQLVPALRRGVDLFLQIESENNRFSQAIDNNSNALHAEGRQFIDTQIAAIQGLIEVNTAAGIHEVNLFSGASIYEAINSLENSADQLALVESLRATRVALETQIWDRIQGEIARAQADGVPIDQTQIDDLQGYLAGRFSTLETVLTELGADSSTTRAQAAATMLELAETETMLRLQDALGGTGALLFLDFMDQWPSIITSDATFQQTLADVTGALHLFVLGNIPNRPGDPNVQNAVIPGTPTGEISIDALTQLGEQLLQAGFTPQEVGQSFESMMTIIGETLNDPNATEQQLRTVIPLAFSNPDDLFTLYTKAQDRRTILQYFTSPSAIQHVRTMAENTPGLWSDYMTWVQANATEATSDVRNQILRHMTNEAQEAVGPNGETVSEMIVLRFDGTHYTWEIVPELEGTIIEFPGRDGIINIPIEEWIETRMGDIQDHLDFVNEMTGAYANMLEAPLTMQDLVMLFYDSEGGNLFGESYELIYNSPITMNEESPVEPTTPEPATPERPIDDPRNVPATPPNPSPGDQTPGAPENIPPIAPQAPAITPEDAPATTDTTTETVTPPELEGNIFAAQDRNFFETLANGGDLTRYPQEYQDQFWQAYNYFRENGYPGEGGGSTEDKPEDRVERAAEAQGVTGELLSNDVMNMAGNTPASRQKLLEDFANLDSLNAVENLGPAFSEWEAPTPLEEIIGDNINSEPFALAQTMLGLHESDPEGNRILREFFRTATGSDLNPAEISWCARFVNAVLSQSGFDTSGTDDMARSFLRIGTPVEEPQVGDIVVFWRVSLESGKGHVGFFAGYDDNGNILVLGGNQNNQVSISPRSADQLLGFRRPVIRTASN